MARYSIRTRDGRSRRFSNREQFNPYTLLPHSRKFIEERKEKKNKKGNK